MRRTEQQPTERSSTFRPSRRALFPLVGAAAALAALAPAALAGAESSPSGQGDSGDVHADGGRAPDRYVYVGTYTAPHIPPGGKVPSTAKGIYVFQMNGATGALTPVQTVENVENPSWVTLDPQLRNLYASSEVDTTWKGVPHSGGLTAYAVDAATGKLSLINDQATQGAIPAHVTVDPTGKYALVANYIGANFAVLPIRPNGGLQPASDIVPVTGSGPNLDRQTAPHPHQILFNPTGKFVHGPDLGTDKVWAWTLDLGAGKLVPNALPYAQVASGSGPRHMAFHPSNNFVYVIDEMVSSITAFRYGPLAGPNAAPASFIWLQTVSTLPEHFSGSSSTAEIVVHPSGKFVYGSNRGHDSIVGFTIDQTTGKLSVIGWTPTFGSFGTGNGFPRSFNIDPSGRLLLVGNQNGNTIVPFRIDQSTGELTPTGHETSTPTPVSIAFGRPV